MITFFSRTVDGRNPDLSSFPKLGGNPGGVKYLVC